jgi:hypothetical protein
VIWPTRVFSTAYFTSAPGEKSESIGMTPIGWSFLLVLLARAVAAAGLDLDLGLELPSLSSVQMTWSGLTI